MTVAARVQTVLGDIAPSQVGRTLIHEHVWITATRSTLSSTIPVQVQIHALCTGRFAT